MTAGLSLTIRFTVRWHAATLTLDVTKFLSAHPGGKKILLSVAGKDASSQFQQYHDSLRVLTKYSHLKVGTIAKNDSMASLGATLGEKFGSDIPFAEPGWYRGMKSPYYKQTHVDFRLKVRQFFETEIRPFIAEWHEQMDYPRELHEKLYKAGIYGAIWPKEYGGTPPPDMDVFHDVILSDEMGRSGFGGLTAALFSLSIALPPILSVGSQEIKDRIARDVITGKKIMALAITEPFAGSDVANIQCTAKRDGEFFVVNGQKKFITSGCKADYFTVAVRTGGEGMGGVSLLLIEKGLPGFTVRRMKTQGWWISNTAHLLFEDVKVPVKNLIGKENQGFIPIMLNFNSERLGLIISACRASRVVIEESIKYARQRNTFGKRLIDHQVIRHKISEMGMRVESLWSNIEYLAFQIHSKVPSDKIIGQISLLKVFATKTMEFCARESSQIFGGNSYLRSGPGSVIERMYREVRVVAIGGGSEEVMFDLAMRQAKL